MQIPGLYRSSLADESRSPSGPAISAPRRYERWIVRRALERKGSPPIAVELWNGERIAPPSGEPVATVRFRDRRSLESFVLNPDPGIGNAYVEGRIEVDGDLPRLVETMFESDDYREPKNNRMGRAFALRVLRTLHRSERSNIHRHYDIGSEFYRLWLDERMLYTCAYFPSPEAGLEEAQLAKMDHVCRKLGLRPGERVIEAGCGWGSLALHMAERYGVSVRAYNISSDQIRYARAEAKRRGLAGRVDFVDDSYTAIGGECDAFVSVGMLEHVGRRHYPELSGVIDRCLTRDGRGLIHSIGRARAQPMSVWLEQNIFPGAYIPALREIMAVFEPSHFEVFDVENLRRHYERTARHWLERFEKHSAEIEAMFDAAFVRTFRLYLATSIAAFHVGSCQLYQLVFTRRGGNVMPWTRSHGVASGREPQPGHAQASRPSAARERAPWIPATFW